MLLANNEHCAGFRVEVAKCIHVYNNDKFYWEKISARIRPKKVFPFNTLEERSIICVDPSANSFLWNQQSARETQIDSKWSGRIDGAKSSSRDPIWSQPFYLLISPREKLLLIFPQGGQTREQSHERERKRKSSKSILAVREHREGSSSLWPQYLHLAAAAAAAFVTAAAAAAAPAMKDIRAHRKKRRAQMLDCPIFLLLFLWEEEEEWIKGKKKRPHFFHGTLGEDLCKGSYWIGLWARLDAQERERI